MRAHCGFARWANRRGSSSMMLLRLLSWPYLRRHLLRWVLTLVGIVLGVAVFVAIHTANRSIFSAFDRTVDQIAGSHSCRSPRVNSDLTSRYWSACSLFPKSASQFL